MIDQHIDESYCGYMMEHMQLGHLVLFLAQHKYHCLHELGQLQPKEEVRQAKVTLHTHGRLLQDAASPKVYDCVLGYVQYLQRNQVLLYSKKCQFKGHLETHLVDNEYARYDLHNIMHYDQFLQFVGRSSVHIA